MDLWTALRVIARRWPIVVATLLLTAVVANVVVATVKPNYDARGTLVLLAPATVVDQGKVVGVNPWIHNPGADRLAAGTVVNVAKGPEFEQRVKQGGGDGRFEVVLDPYAPMITVAATAPEPGDALDTLAIVIDLVKRELAERQRAAGAPPDTWITADLLTISEEATERPGRRFRALAGVVVAGVAMSLVLAFVVEAVSRARRRRAANDLRRARTPPRAPGPMAGATPAPPGDGRPGRATERDASRPARR